MKPDILIVDDENEILSVLSDFILEVFPEAQIDTAINGLGGFIRCVSKKYDLIITDHRMPRMTGADFVWSLQEQENLNKETKIIFVSAFLPEFKTDVETLDHVIFLEKPLDIEGFQRNVKILTNIKGK